MFSILNNFVNDTEIKSDILKSDKIFYGSDNASKEFLEAVSARYDVSELKDLIECSESTVVCSAAGSGKTTFLLLKVIYDILDGRYTVLQAFNGVEYKVLQPILVCTFLRSGSEDIRIKFFQLLNEFKVEGIPTNGVHFSTIHAEVFDVWKSLGIVPNISSDNMPVLREIVKRQKVTRNKKAFIPTDYEDLDAVITFARNRLDKTRYEHPLMRDFGLDKVKLDLLIDECANLRNMLNVKDFEDMEENLYSAYSLNPDIRAYVGSRYKGVYVDEFQDTSQLQYGILKPYFENSLFTLVGDINQAIYSWRGSDVRIMDSEVAKDFVVKEYNLIMNRRTGEDILKAVVPSIKKNSQKSQVFRASNTGGALRTVSHFNPLLIKCIGKDYKLGNSIAILGRTNKSLIVPILQMLIYKIPFVATNGCTLSGFYGIFTSCFKLFHNSNGSDLGKVLRFLCPSGAYEVSKLISMLSCNANVTIFNLDLDDLEYSCPNLKEFLEEFRKVVPNGIYGDDAEKRAGLIWLLNSSIDNFRLKTSGSYNDKALCEYLLYALAQGPLKDVAFKDIESMFTKDFPLSLRNSISNNPADGKVFISTVHTAKGKEWDSVYIWASDTDFPYNLPNLVPSKEYFEEERRVFYIAVTRAKKQCTFLTNEDIVANKGFKKGSYISECDLSKSTIAFLSKNEIKFGELKRYIQ